MTKPETKYTWELVKCLQLQKLYDNPDSASSNSSNEEQGAGILQQELYGNPIQY